MKKFLVILAAALVVPMSVGAASSTLTFTTGSPASGGPFVFDTDGTTKLANGAGFFGQIYAGPDAGSLVAVGSAVEFGSTAGAFFDGLIPGGGVVEVANVNAVSDSVGGVGSYQIRAWGGSHASYENAVSAGANTGVSDVVNGVTMGTLQVAGPNVNGFTSFQLVPEPGTITLGLLGLGGLIASRRRKNA
jgi:hypothetical protein